MENKFDELFGIHNKPEHTLQDIHNISVSVIPCFMLLPPTIIWKLNIRIGNMKIISILHSGYVSKVVEN